MLKPEQIVTLNAGTPVPGENCAIIAAGTGLGEAGLVWDRSLNGYRAFPSEGGHADFGPRTDQEIALLKFLQAKKITVTWESVLSGPGLKNIYDFLITPAQLGPDAPSSKPEIIPADITAAALAGIEQGLDRRDGVVRSFLRRESGNLALKLLAVGGVYLGGGIARIWKNSNPPPSFRPSPPKARKDASHAREHSHPHHQLRHERPVRRRERSGGCDGSCTSAAQKKHAMPLRSFIVSISKASRRCLRCWTRNWPERM